jgi:N-methylhydantoinase A/oxoprolinase/acetone carboxylase beta subunit
MRIGVDVGGTNTDAAVMLGNEVLASTKSSTTADIASGVTAAIRDVLAAARVDTRSIQSVMIGTTQFTNAFVERRRLSEVAVIRLGLPATASLPPLTGWPQPLVDAVGHNIYMLAGGFEVDGREIAPLDEDGLARAVSDIRTRGITSIAISSVFSPINPAMEVRARAIIHRLYPQARVSLASDIGRVGLVERENAAVMNASLADLSHQVVSAFKAALEGLKLHCPFFISQNDGTLMSADYVERYPVLTFASGPTNSMRGAAYLSGLEDAVVVDIGGTTSDIGVLQRGFPRESSVPVDIGGVRTNFRMPDVLAIGLGGGSIVHTEVGLRVGPESVGYRLVQEAIVFGGQTLTATDVAVAAGYAEVGDVSRVRGVLAPELIEGAVQEMHTILEAGIERVKSNASDVTAILVGGGSILVSRPLKGVSNLIVPERSAEANAIGAAIAQVGGETDRVFFYSETGRDSALEQARDEATNRAIEAGGTPESVKVVDIEELPLGYGSGSAVRLRVKVVADLSLGEAA